MFDNFKMMGQVAKLMGDKDKLRQAGERVKSELRSARIDRESGGGAVRVTVDGQGKVLDIQLSPALASGLGDEASRTMAQGLIVQAVNDATAAALRLMVDTLNREAAALGLPALPSDVDRLLSERAQG